MEDCNRRIIAPSVLASDWAHIAEEVARTEAAGADWLHLDVMDGHFVPNISFGPQFVAAIRPHSGLPLDVHLMLTRPDIYFPEFVKAGADRITVHIEAEHNVGETLQKIRDSGCKCGLAINPDSNFHDAEPYLDQIDLMLVMTVRPGFGGQAFMADETMPKVAAARDWRRKHDLNYHIQVDGGIDTTTVATAGANGANVMVAGTSLFKADDMAEAIEIMRMA